ncbi:hypothetical protein HMI55_003197 [Coelomomyces lativittatus]|nr:hypothetical protein HMI55_003197 [Coelomomyces lativittatus]
MSTTASSPRTKWKTTKEHRGRGRGCWCWWCSSPPPPPEKGVKGVHAPFDST